MRSNLIKVTLFLLLSPFLLIQAQDLPENAASLPIAHLLTLASQALSSGRSNSALTIYDHCLERDPTDFATLYKRATLRLATGQWAKAKEGFAEVLRIKEFDQAHWQLAKLHAKVGEFTDALLEVDTFLRMQSRKESKEFLEATELRTQIVRAQADLATAQRALANTPPQLLLCIQHATTGLVVAPNSEALRLVRAECYFLSGDLDSNIGDLSRAAALSPSLAPYLLLRISLLSSLFINNGLSVPTDALQSIKKCLASDPDSKPCRKAFKALKALEKELAKLRNYAEAGSWNQAAVALAGSSSSEGLIKTVENLIETYQVPLPTSPDSPAPLLSTPNLSHTSPLLTNLLSLLCKSYVALNQTKKMATACEAILARNPNDQDGLVYKGEQLLIEEKWDEAVNVFNQAFEQSGRSSQDILNRMQKAQRLLKMSTAKDYYKVLGVDRNADKKAVKKAYRTMTLKHHPDKAGGSEAKMQAINEAYEVLSTPELKQRFDNGEDPNDPTNNNHQQHNHHHFFHQQQHQFFQQQQQGQQFNFHGGFKF